MAFLLAKPTPLNVNHGNDRFSTFNKKRDIAIKGAEDHSGDATSGPGLCGGTVEGERSRDPLFGDEPGYHFPGSARKRSDLTLVP